MSAAPPSGFPGNLTLSGRVALAVGTSGYVGFFPVAPGTAGSLAGVGLFLLARMGGTACTVIMLFLAVVAGVWAAGRCALMLGRKDPPVVVIDEVAGMLLSLLLAPRGWVWILAAFLLFRVFDIVKPPPAGWADRELEGGWGIMLDDLAAGGYTWLVIQAAHVVVR